METTYARNRVISWDIDDALNMGGAMKSWDIPNLYPMTDPAGAGRKMQKNDWVFC